MRLLHILVDGLLADTLLIFPAVVLVGHLIARKSVGQSFAAALRALLGWLALLAGAWALLQSLGVLDGLLGTLLGPPAGARRAELAPYPSLKDSFAHAQAVAMLLAYAINIAWARLSRARYIFCNPIQLLLGTGALLLLFSRGGASPYLAVPLTGAVIGSAMAWLPWVANRLGPLKEGDRLALGTFHTGLLAAVAWLGARLGPRLGGATRGKGKRDDAGLIDSPIVFGSFVIGAVCLLLAINAGEKQTAQVLAGLVLTKALPAVGASYYLVGAALCGFVFGAGLWILLEATPMILNPLGDAFAGFQKYVANVRPAVDALFILPENPRAAVTGFMLSVCGGVTGMYLWGLIGFTAAIPGMLVSLTAGHLVLGGAAGVIGERCGGQRAAWVLAFAHGLVLSLLVSISFAATGGLGRGGPVGTELSDLSLLDSLLGALLHLLS